jgi:hypothetical protein
MAKVVFGDLKTGRSKKSTSRGIGKKRVVSANGRTKTLLVLDVNSPSFDEDLHYAFSRNVAKARRENKRLFGSADVAPRKR